MLVFVTAVKVTQLDQANIVLWFYLFLYTTIKATRANSNQTNTNSSPDIMSPAKVTSQQSSDWIFSKGEDFCFSKHRSQWPPDSSTNIKFIPYENAFTALYKNCFGFFVNFSITDLFELKKKKKKRLKHNWRYHMHMPGGWVNAFHRTTCTDAGN